MESRIRRRYIEYVILTDYTILDISQTMRASMTPGLARSPEQLGQLIRAARLARGWSQGDLAQRAGMHQPMVSTIERGHPGAGLASIFALMAALDLELVVQERSKSSDDEIAGLF